MEDINRLISILKEATDKNAYLAADKLAEIGGEEVRLGLLDLLKSPDYDTVYLAARALSKLKDNQLIIENIFEFIKNGEQPFIKGVLTEALAGFDCSEYFNELFKLFLFGNLKVSAMAKEILDTQEFAITPRVIRKAEKHWNHYLHNVKQGDDVEAKKAEVESMFEVMKELFEDESDELTSSS